VTQAFDPKQAIDLSSLSKPNKPNLPPGTFTCTVGCGLTVRGTKPHETVEDCLQTALPYVDMYLEIENVTKTQMVPAMQQLERQRAALLDANERLRRDNEVLKRDLREARRGTPEAARSVLEGAADLAASMKEAVQPVETRVQPSSSDAREYLLGMGVPATIVNATPDDGLSDLYEQYAGSS
jgi:hypothetical protein